MADVTISSLPLGTPSGNGIIPFSLGGNTYSASISGIFQNRPAFLALNNSSASYGSGVHNLSYTFSNSTTFNIGNHFNGTRFVAPYTGVYHFDAGDLINSRTGGNYHAIYFYNSRLNDIYRIFSLTSQTFQQSLNISGNFSVIAGDQIGVQLHTNGTVIRDNSGYFSGYFIG